MVETHKKEKNTVITKITLTISNAEHIRQTLSTSRHDHHQQHLPKISLLDFYPYNYSDLTGVAAQHAPSS